MEKEIYALAFDIGTTGVKTCLFKIGKTIELLSAASEGYKLYIMPNGGAESNSIVLPILKRQVLTPVVPISKARA